MTQTTFRYFHKYSDVLHPVRTPQEGVPTVYDQAEKLGGTFTRITKGLPEDSFVNFSPSIIPYQDKTYIAWRSQPQPFGFRWDNKYFYLNDSPNEVYIGILHDDKTILGTKKLRSKKHRLSYEDPRLFIGPDKELYVSFIGSTYASKWDRFPRKLFAQPKVIVCHVDEVCEATKSAIPPIGGNRIPEVPEKNWCFFSKNEELHCLYSTRPLAIEREYGERIEVDSSVLDQVTQGHATFNSTAPISLGYGYLVFYHWKHMTYAKNGRPYLLYHMSAYLLDKDLKNITHVVKEPLFTGSLNDQVIEWTDYAGNAMSAQPAVILPFGVYIQNTELIMSLGVNDAFMGIFRCPLESIMKKMERVN